MSATPLNVGAKFSALDGLAIVFVPVIAAGTLIPTRPEINAGTDLTSECDGPGDGFRLEADTIEVNSLARFSGTIPGRIKITPGVLRLHQDRGDDDVRDVLPAGTTGYIVMMDNGDVPTKLMDIWPVRVNTLSKVRAADAPNMLEVAFTHDRLPKVDAIIPAAT